MSPQLETVLEISAFGTTILFGALLGLIGLMYLLTSQRLSSVVSTQPDESASEAPDVAALEQERKLRAIALAVAVAHATSRQSPLLQAVTKTSNWHRLHQTRRLTQPTRRLGSRS